MSKNRKFQPNADIMGAIRTRIGEAENPLSEAGEGTVLIPLSHLKGNAHNFFSMDEEGLLDLAEDIERNGLIHSPVVYKESNGEYTIVSGHRRVRAYALLAEKFGDRYTSVPCAVHAAVSDAEAELLMISANLQTRVLTNEERRIAATRLMELIEIQRASGMVVVEGRLRDFVGAQMGISGATVEKLMRIDRKLIAPLQRLYDEGSLALSSAFDATALTEEQQQALYEMLIGHAEAVTRDQIAVLRDELSRRERSQNMEINKKDKDRGNKARESASTPEVLLGAQLEALLKTAERRVDVLCTFIEKHRQELPVEALNAVGMRLRVLSGAIPIAAGDSMSEA